MSFYFLNKKIEYDKKAKIIEDLFMSFFKKNNTHNLHIKKKIIKKNVTLQVQGYVQFLYKESKRIYLNTLKEKGAMTVEMAIAFPLFLFAFLAIFFFGQMFLVDQEIQKGAMECARKIARTEHPEVNIVLAKTYWKEYVDTKYLNQTFLKNGTDGVTFFGSYYDENSGKVILKVQYKLEVMIPAFHTFSYHGSYEIHQKSFRGYRPDLEGEDEQYVYVTEHQSVYHISRSCSYLQLKIRQDTSVEKYLLGNTSYQPCEFCMKKSKNPAILYVTEEGKKYHSTLMCSALKRTIKRVKKSEVGSLHLCSRCGKKEKKE